MRERPPLEQRKVGLREVEAEAGLWRPLPRAHEEWEWLSRRTFNYNVRCRRCQRALDIDGTRLGQSQLDGLNHFLETCV